MRQEGVAGEYVLVEQVRKVMEEREALVRGLEPRPGETPMDALARLRYDRETLLIYRSQHPSGCECEACGRMCPREGMREERDAAIEIGRRIQSERDLAREQRDSLRAEVDRLTAELAGAKRLIDQFRAAMDTRDLEVAESLSTAGNAVEGLREQLAAATSAREAAERAAETLAGALEAAQEELRLLRMKDTATVYDPTLKTRITMALASYRKPEEQKEQSR